MKNDEEQRQPIGGGLYGLIPSAHLGTYEKPTQAHDNGQQPQVLLYGPRGETLMERRPRPVGFRPRSER